MEVDLRDNIDCVPAGLNESKTCSINNVVTGIFNSLDPGVPHNAGSFRRITVHLREGCVVGIPKFPTSCSVATTNVGDRLVNITQAAFAQIGDGFGLAEGGLGMGPPYAVISGNDPAGRRALRQPADHRQQRRARRAVGRRLGHLRDARRAKVDVHRQRRGPASRISAADPPSLRLLTDSGGAACHPRGSASETVYGLMIGFDAVLLLRPTSRSLPARRARWSAGSRDAPPRLDAAGERDRGSTPIGAPSPSEPGEWLVLGLEPAVAATATRPTRAPDAGAARRPRRLGLARARRVSTTGSLSAAPSGDESLAVDEAETLGRCARRCVVIEMDEDPGRRRNFRHGEETRNETSMRLRSGAHPRVGMAACGSGSGSSDSGDSTSASSDEPIKLGFAIGETGSREPFDGPAQVAADFAIEDINADGGASGRQLETTTANTKSKPSSETRPPRCSTTAPTSSSPAATSTRARRPRSSPTDGVLAFSTCAASTAFGPNGFGPLAFTMATAAPAEGASMAEWAYDKQGFKSAVVLLDDTIEFDKQSAYGFQTRFSDLGGDSQETFKQGDASIASQINAIKSADPDAIYLASYMPGEASAIKQLRAAGVDVPILADEDIDGDYWKGGVPDLNDVFFATYASIYGDDPDPKVNDFVDRYKAKTGKLPDTSAFLTGYAMIQAITKAVEGADGPPTAPTCRPSSSSSTTRTCCCRRRSTTSTTSP